MREATPQEWAETWRECRHALFCHSREWYEIWSRYYGGLLTSAPRWLVFSDGRKALIPLATQRIHHGLITEHVSSPGDGCGGWLTVDDLQPAHGELIVEHLLELPNLRWRLNPFDRLVRALDIPVTREDSTAVLDLAPGLDATLQRWSRPYRENLEHARKEGVEIVRATSIEHWRAYYEIYRLGSGGRGRPLGWSLFDSIYARGAPDMSLWLAVRRRELLAGALCFYARHHGVCWQAATADGDRGRGAVFPLLFGELLRDATQRRLRWFELGRRPANGGVALPTRHLGAESLRCGRIDNTTRAHKLVDTLSAIKAAARPKPTPGRP